MDAGDAHGRKKNIFGEPRSKCGRRDAEDVKFRSADVVEGGSRRSAEVVEAGSRWTWRGSACSCRLSGLGGRGGRAEPARGVW